MDNKMENYQEIVSTIEIARQVRGAGYALIGISSLVGLSVL